MFPPLQFTPVGLLTTATPTTALPTTAVPTTRLQVPLLLIHHQLRRVAGNALQALASRRAASGSHHAAHTRTSTTGASRGTRVPASATKRAARVRPRSAPAPPAPKRARNSHDSTRPSPPAATPVPARPRRAAAAAAASAAPHGAKPADSSVQQCKPAPKSAPPRAGVGRWRADMRQCMACVRPPCRPPPRRPPPRRPPPRGQRLHRPSGCQRALPLVGRGPQIVRRHHVCADHSAAPI
eukprot:gene9305-biopygen19717